MGKWQILRKSWNEAQALAKYWGTSSKYHQPTKTYYYQLKGRSHSSIFGHWWVEAEDGGAPAAISQGKQLVLVPQHLPVTQPNLLQPFEALLGTSWHFLVLLGTSWCFLVLGTFGSLRWLNPSSCFKPTWATTKVLLLCVSPDPTWHIARHCTTQLQPSVCCAQLYLVHCVSVSVFVLCLCVSVSSCLRVCISVLYTHVVPRTRPTFLICQCDLEDRLALTDPRPVAEGHQKWHSNKLQCEWKLTFWSPDLIYNVCVEVCGFCVCLCGCGFCVQYNMRHCY